MDFFQWHEIALATFGLVFVFLLTGVPWRWHLALWEFWPLFYSGSRWGHCLRSVESQQQLYPWRDPIVHLHGQLLLHSGISRRIYDGSTAFVGGTKGGLLQANIVASGIFSAVTGSSVATAATVGAMAIPELERRGYDKQLTKGSLAAGGTLGILIPPSTALIIYGVIVEESIGDLFVAGILPGLMLAGLFMLYIWLRVLARPNIAPAFVATHVKQRFRDILSMWPVFLIMFVILAGIYMGIMTPAEAAAVGASMALLFVIAYRRLTWDVLRSSLLGTVKTTSMLVFIMINASIVSGALALSHIPDQLAEWVLSLTCAGDDTRHHLYYVCNPRNVYRHGVDDRHDTSNRLPHHYQSGT